MKKLMVFLFIGFFSIVAFARRRTGYFEGTQTKESVWNYAKEYEKLYTSKGVQIATVKSNSKYDYENDWRYPSNNAVLTARVHYQFFDDRVVIHILEAGLIPDGKAKINLTEEDSNPTKKNLYEALQNMIVFSFFTNLKLSETKPTHASVKNETKELFIENGYDFVTRNYKANQTKEMAKEKNLSYILNVIKPTFQVTFLSDKNSDNFDVKYFKHDEGEISTTIIVNYKFYNKDFSIYIKSLEVIKDIDKSKVIVNKYISTEPQKQFYEFMKSSFVDGHANYISPK